MKHVKNISASVRQRLLKQSQQDRRPFNELFQYYAQVIIYQSEDGLTHIDVKLEDETIWITQQQMAELFQSSRTNIVEHIGNIYLEGELD